MFSVLVIYPPSKHLMRNTILFLCIQLEKQINGCKAFALKDKIVAIFDMKRVNADKDKIIFELEQFLLKNQLQGGMSTQFSDLKELQSHIHQAIYAFETGSSQAEPTHLYLFQGYLLKYMLLHAGGKLDARYLIPEGIMKLKEHDRAVGSQYIKVLQVYLENKCNITDSAKELYLGRSTFLYQLDRIKAILNMDLNDKDVRLTLLLVLRLNTPNKFF